MEVKLISATNLSFASEDKTTILMTVEVEGVAEITEPVEFVASAFDVMPHGVEFYKRARLGEFGTVKQYEHYVQTEADLLEEARMLFESEKQIALRIEEDYRLELANISDKQMREVKEYIRAINPTAATRDIPNRPEIMKSYKYN
ncbi:hypothetical protein PVK63_06430 [Aliivibrio sp. S2TY2]|uniref:hypothetical protein n=1 Tax=unclassified Aliivibrio TaxID=2645654 RepID=UPI002379E5B2|nr:MULTISPECIES: hypothetical protein [unclassified Aliivibrio]MDD9174507.1 hypothetical protein [Aliivibrio sp. S3TY1]MDD9191585.1 hypothetical protein [Aliivibrio sp. S2TY2]